MTREAGARPKNSRSETRMNWYSANQSRRENQQRLIIDKLNRALVVYISGVQPFLYSYTNIKTLSAA